MLTLSLPTFVITLNAGYMVKVAPSMQLGFNGKTPQAIWLGELSFDYDMRLLLLVYFLLTRNASNCFCFSAMTLSMPASFSAWR